LGPACRDCKVSTHCMYTYTAVRAQNKSRHILHGIQVLVVCWTQPRGIKKLSSSLMWCYPTPLSFKYTHRCNSQVLRNNMVLERSCTGGCKRVVHLRFEAGQILHWEKGRQAGREERGQDEAKRRGGENRVWRQTNTPNKLGYTSCTPTQASEHTCIAWRVMIVFIVCRLRGRAVEKSDFSF